MIPTELKQRIESLGNAVEEKDWMKEGALICLQYLKEQSYAYGDKSLYDPQRNHLEWYRHGYIDGMLSINPPTTQGEILSMLLTNALRMLDETGKRSLADSLYERITPQPEQSLVDEMTQVLSNAVNGVGFSISGIAQACASIAQKRIDESKAENELLKLCLKDNITTMEWMWNLLEWGQLAKQHYGEDGYDAYCSDRFNVPASSIEMSKQALNKQP